LAPGQLGLALRVMVLAMSLPGIPGRKTAFPGRYNPIWHNLATSPSFAVSLLSSANQSQEDRARHRRNRSIGTNFLSQVL
jgi:hypothetical protein